MPPSSLYCSQKSVSRISAAAAKRSNAASPALSVLGVWPWASTDVASAKSEYPTPTAPAAIAYFMNERRLLDVLVVAVPVSITEVMVILSFPHNYLPKALIGRFRFL